MKKLIMFVVGLSILFSSFAVDVTTAKSEIKKYMSDKNAEYVEIIGDDEGTAYLKKDLLLMILIDNYELILNLAIPDDEFELPMDLDDISSIKYTSPVLSIIYAGDDF